MDPMSFGSFFQQFGWLVFLLYFLMERIWPWMSQSLFPQRFAAENARIKREQDWQERQIAAYEQIAKAVAELAVTNAMTNERLNTLMIMHSEHDRLTSEAITAMRERTATRRPAQQARSKDS